MRSCERSTRPGTRPVLPASPEGERLVLAIGGMTCAACARRVEKALKKAPGVQDAVVNLATHRATVIYKPGATAEAALAAAVLDVARWLALALAMAVIGVAAPIYRAAWSAVRHRAADMNVLVALGTGAAF